MTVTDLESRSFGPHPLQLCEESVRDFVAATGDDAGRWVEAAPPGFLARALFVVAPELLDLVADRSVIHGEQTYSWRRPFLVESELDVVGKVSRVRERGGVHFVSFDVEAGDETGPVASGSSLFLLSGTTQPGAGAEERVEPAPDERGNPEPGQVSASRADLVRYAGATRDWNPVHWDHAAAVAAGLPGVVAHGLLQASWALAAASALRDGDRPLAAAKVRFRTPLPAAVPVSSTVDESDGVANVVLAAAGVEYLSARVELEGR